jgi:folate-binding protein YgfZ
VSADYEAVRDGLGWIDRSGRIRLRFRGPDRVRSLQNLVTNDLKARQPGQGAEAFLTSPPGKTLGFLRLLVDEEEVLVGSDPGTLDLIAPHLGKYCALDDVEFEDVSAGTFEVHLAGPRADAALDEGPAPPGGGEYDHLPATIAGVPVRAIRESPTGRAGLTLIGPAGSLGEVRARLKSLGAAAITPECWEVLRVEAGFPAYFREVGPDNLPQELGRDERAISFKKGCYLGQETVARLDALGHVNKLLRALIIDGAEAPAAGSSLETEDGQAAGTVTSSGFSPALGHAVALVIVRVKLAPLGALLRARGPGGAEITARVAEWPLIPGLR